MSDVLDSIYDAAEGTTWDANKHGLWCPVCGWHVAPPHFFDEPDFRPTLFCRECGHAAGEHQ